MLERVPPTMLKVSQSLKNLQSFGHSTDYFSANSPPQKIAQQPAGNRNQILATLEGCADRLQQFQSQSFDVVNTRDKAKLHQNRLLDMNQNDDQRKNTINDPLSNNNGGLQVTKTTSIDQNNITEALSQNMNTLVFNESQSGRDALMNALQYMKQGTVKHNHNIKQVDQREAV